MARTAMTIRSRPSAYSITPLDLAALDAFDEPNGMTLPATGDIALEVNNPTVGAVTLTVHSQPDPYGRSSDITAFSIAAGHTIYLQEFPAAGWATGGVVQIDASATGLLYAAIQRA